MVALSTAVSSKRDYRPVFVQADDVISVAVLGMYMPRLEAFWCPGCSTCDYDFDICTLFAGQAWWV